MLSGAFFIFAGFGGLILYILCDIVDDWLDSRKNKRKKNS